MADLSQLDPIGRFNNRVEDYVKYRPAYPAGAILAILDGLGPPERVTAADVGAGTGIAARLLGDRGVHVIAIEPGEAMRSAAAPHPRVTWTAGTAEATGLRSASVDLVLSAQSFHWFRAAGAIVEFGRILRSGGRLAIMWNRRSRTDPFTARYRQLLLDVGGESTVEQLPFDVEVIARSGMFAQPDRRAFPNSQRLDFDGLAGRTRSTSYAPKTGEDGDRLLMQLRALFDAHADADGCVTLVYETEVFLATRR